MPDAATPVTLATGYLPGAIGAIAALHGRHYAASHGFDQVFEAKVARELGGFCCPSGCAGRSGAGPSTRCG